MTHQILKDFWINKINNLLTNFSVDPNTLDAGADWAEKMNDMGKWLDIEHFGKNICQDIYVKAGKVAPKSFTKGDNYGKVLNGSFTDYELQFIDLVNVFKTRLGINPLDDTTVKSDDKDVLEWKWKISRKFPHTDRQYTLKDMGDLDLLDLLYDRDLYLQITNNLNDLILKGSNLSNAYGYKGWKTKVNKTVLQNYKNNQTLITNVANHLKTILGLAPTAVVPNDWHTKLVKKTDLDAYENGLKAVLNNDLTNWQNKLNQGQQKANEYQRIHTKLNSKVSDDDLTNLLNSGPSCSHSDYDDIKQALADEKEKLTKKEESWELEKKAAQAEKEKEIINKIITDLGLTTEREKNKTLKAVITEIKAKITPPTDTTDKDKKITELQEQITNLKAPKTLKDLPISKGIKEEVIKISQELGLTAQSCAKLEKATSYQELSSWQKQALQERLDKETADKNSANYLNWALGILTLGSLMVLAWMIIRQSKGILPELEKEEGK
jgi:hypothetical protein